MKFVAITAILFASAMALPGADAPAVHPIDLATALRLAGASSLEVKLAQAKVAEASANYEGARQKFFPWLTLGTTYRRHENNIQAVDGQILDVNKHSLAAGLGASAEWSLGEAIFQELAQRQTVRAAEFVSQVKQQQVILTTVKSYYALLLARVNEDVARESLRLAASHAEQADAAQSAGLIDRGNAWRVETQRAHEELGLAQATESRRLASAHLATILRLEPWIDLEPAERELAPLSIVPADMELSTLITRALAQRPEVGAISARVAASREELRGARVAPLVPTLSVQAEYGGLGGGAGGSSPGRKFDVAEDYVVGLRWKIGPGGLLDRSRIHLQDARKRSLELTEEQVRDEIRLEVFTAFTALQSLQSQIEIARTAMSAAEKTASFSRDRRSFQIAAVLEDIQAENDLNRARRDYAAAVANYNEAQFALQSAIGDSHPRDESRKN